MFKVRSFTAFDILKVTTLVLLIGLLIFLGSATRSTSIFAYFALSMIVLLQIFEVLAPPFSVYKPNQRSRILFLRASIALQLLLASLLVAVTDGAGSIYELVFLLPIISAAAKLRGKDVIIVVGCAILSMVGFIIADMSDPPSPTETRELQDALAAIVYFTLAGLLTYYFAKAERDQRYRLELLTNTLTKTNDELQLTQQQLSDHLTEVAQMEERLQRITQMATLGEVAGQMAHEIRNPLGIIKGAANILAKKATDPSILQHLAVLQEEVNHLNTAVEGVLRLGTPLRIQSTTIDLVSLLKKIAQVSTAWAIPSQSVIHFPAPLKPCTVEGDYDLLHQAFTNLVRNGLQAMSKSTGGALSIHMEPSPSEEEIIVTITDSGIGLSDLEASRLGEPFFTKRPGGIGLGFSLVKRIIKEHGGSIEVESEPGQGTSVLVHLPAHSPVPPQPESESAPI
ncbi:MAG: nitrogen regulation protein NR(II) [Nitrospirales bacterium]|nr:ATP-binding protein [Nitrospirales bacterium]